MVIFSQALCAYRDERGVPTGFGSLNTCIGVRVAVLCFQDQKKNLLDKFLFSFFVI